LIFAMPCLLGRGFIRFALATDLLGSFFVAGLFLSALPHNTLIGWPTGRRSRHSSLTAMLAALILLSL